MLKLGEYEMWEIRIKQYFQIQDYALWEVIENGNSWVPIPVTSPAETGTSTGTKMTVPSTAEEKTCKKNDVKARSLLLMALPNEHQLTFDQLQKLVSRLAILGVVTPPEDLNVKFLRSLPSEWDTHVVVWMNKPDFDTMGLDDLYNNFKIVEQKVKKSVGTNNDDKNLAFLTTSGASSTNIINTVNPEVSTGNTKVNTASTEISTASFSDATVYAFLSTQPQGSQLVHEDLEQLHDDDLEEMDLKWNMALLSMRARKFYQRTGRKIIIDGSNTAGYDKSKVECFNCHKMGHFARECRAPRSKDNRNWNQGSSSKAVKIEDASEKAMCAIDGAGFDWSDMAEEEIQANMALMAFSDSEVTNDKSCSKSCLKNYEALKKQYDDLLVKLDDTGFKASTYKRGLSILEGQILKYKEFEVLFSEEIALLKRSVGHKEYLESVSQMCDKKNSVLFTDTECVVLSPDFKLTDKSHVLLKVPRKDNMYSVDLKNVVQKHVMMQRSPDAGFKPSGEEEKKDAEDQGNEDSEVPSIEEPRINQEKDDNINSTNNINTASNGNSTSNINDVSSTVNVAVTEVNDVDPKTSIELPNDLNMPELEDIVYSNDDEDVGAEADMNTLDARMPVSPIPTIRIHKDHQFGLWWIYQLEENGLIGTNGVLQEQRKDEEMDVKSAFLYRKIEEEVYVCQPLGFKDPDFPDRVYKVEKALYDLHQAPRVAEEIWDFYQSSKYVTEILKKFGFTDVKTPSTPMETHKPLLKDADGKDVDEHLYRTMIGSLMYLTSSRPDIIYLKGQPKLGLWYPKDALFDLVAYTVEH
ncbi:ribonuclease H-like domain-containing protein [Tanacetum coccineum]